MHFKDPIFVGSENRIVCEHIENDLPTHESVSLKKRMEIEHALFSSDILLER